MTHRLSDPIAGLLVALIALPLSLGIATASGFPPIAGLITAILGGLVATWFGSAPLTIKGPAAGLIVIVLGAVTELGQGDVHLGYRRALAVGVVAGLLQIALALARAGGLAAIVPPSVIHGLLAAIGVIIITRQLPVMLGVKTEHHEPLDLLLHFPSTLMAANPEILLIGLVALATLLALPRLPALRQVPAPLVALALTVPLGIALHLSETHSYVLAGHTYVVGPAFLVDLPASLADAFVFPDFSAIRSAVSLRYIVLYTLIGAIESSLSVLAIDALDPKRRASSLDHDLFATGVGTMLASAVGGLPMISEIVRSKANLDAGARGRAANAYHGLWLLVALVAFPSLLEHIPTAALAAMLVYTGARLASPTELRHAWQVGPDQLAVFATTLVVTLASDLLIGVAAGFLLKLALHLGRGASLRDLLRGGVTTERHGATLRVSVVGPAVFTKVLAVRAAFAAIDPEIQTIELDLHRATLVDHTFLDKVHHAGDELSGASLVILGLDDLHPSSDHPLASRRRRR